MSERPRRSMVTGLVATALLTGCAVGDACVVLQSRARGLVAIGGPAHGHRAPASAGPAASIAPSTPPSETDGPDGRADAPSEANPGPDGPQYALDGPDTGPAQSPPPASAEPAGPSPAPPEPGGPEPGESPAGGGSDAGEPSPGHGGPGGPPPSTGGLDARLADALDGLAPAGAAVSVAVLDTANGATAVYGHDAYDTASIVKVDILAGLLLRAQDAGRPLTEPERHLAAAMITRSDNRAATALWHRIGGARGLDEANRRLGLTTTRGAVHWGLTQTTAADQLTLLKAVFLGNSALNDDSRRYMQRLMGQIERDQAWGVSAAADDANGTMLKNGWTQRSNTWLWDVNSIGRLSSGGHQLLIAVLSRGSVTQLSGISLVEAAAQAAVRTVLGG